MRTVETRKYSVRSGNSGVSENVCFTATEDRKMPAPLRKGSSASQMTDAPSPPPDQPKVPSIETQEERIRKRAYEIWTDEGQPEGRQDEHWHRAREEIEAELARQASSE